jgi:YD repeat-containing protein
VSYTWTGTGNLSEVRDVLGYVWKYGYDANGQLTSVADPEGRVTSVSYVQSFRAGGVAVPPGIGFSGKPGRDFRISRVSVLRDALERETRYSYVYNRQQERFEVVERSPLNRVTERWYDLKGRLDRQVEGERVSYERRRDGDLISYERDERGHNK